MCALRLVEHIVRERSAMHVDFERLKTDHRLIEYSVECQEDIFRSAIMFVK